MSWPSSSWSTFARGPFTGTVSDGWLRITGVGLTTRFSPGYIWKPVFLYRGRFYLHNLRHCLSPVHVRQQKKLEWLESLSPVGKNPFELTGVYRVWAGESWCLFFSQPDFFPIPQTLPCFDILSVCTSRIVTTRLNVWRHRSGRM